MNKYRVTLTAEERTELERLVSVGKGAARKLTHARILLLADTAAGAEHADEEIVAALRVGLCTVGRVRQRLVTQGLPAALNPRAQPQRPDTIKIKGDVEQALIRLACSEPPEGRCHWTLQLLADELVVLGLVEDISTETVRQALKKLGWQTQLDQAFFQGLQIGVWILPEPPAQHPGPAALFPAGAYGLPLSEIGGGQLRRGKAVRLTRYRRRQARGAAHHQAGRGILLASDAAQVMAQATKQLFQVIIGPR